jgi:hypothetical protein
MQRAWTAVLPASLIFGLCWLAYGFATTDVTSALPSWGQSWSLIRFCLVVAATGTLLLLIFGRSIAPLVVAIGLFALVLFGPAAVMANAALLWCAYLLGELIHRREPSETDRPTRLFFRLALGLIVLALLLNVAIALPVHSPEIYSIVLLALIVLRWRTSVDLAGDLRMLWGFCRIRLEFSVAVISIAIGVIVCVQLAYAGFPERQHDALAAHLVVAQVVKTAGQWHFAADFVVGAAQALGADWLYAIMYVVAGESGARLTNYLFIALVAALVYALSLQFGRVAAALVTLVLLSCPIAFLESDGIYLDNFLMLCMTTGLALCGLWSTLSSRDRVLSCGVVVGGLPTAKLHGVVGALILLGLAFANKLARDVRVVDRKVILAGITLVALGAVPYLIALAVTGNPIFPFFNAFFKSPYLSVWNFTGVFPPDVSPSVLHRLTFNTSNHFQGRDGTFGFQLVVFLFPVIVAAFMRPCFLVVSSLVLMFVYGLVVLAQTADARYFYVVMPALSISMALAIRQLCDMDSRGFAALGFVSVVLVSALNFIYFPGAGGTLPQFESAALIDSRARNAMIREVVPQRLLIEKLNMTDGPHARLVLMGQAVGFPLLGTPIFVNWYMHNVFAEMVKAKTNDEVARWLASLGATHLMMPVEGVKIWNEDAIRRYLATEAEPVAVIGNESLYRISADVMFPIRLGRLDDWSRRSAGPDGIALPQNENMGYATPPLSADQRSIRIGIRARCDNDRGQVAIHVYWTVAGGAAPLLEGGVWPCANGIDRPVSASFARPRQASGATIYLIKLGEGQARISEASVSTTAITLPEPLPLFARDWSASPVWRYIKRSVERRLN